MSCRLSLRPLLIGLAALALALSATVRAHAEAKLLIEAATGKVLHAENATLPWYPASVTKLMTTYTTLRAIRDGRLGLNTLLTVPAANILLIKLSILSSVFGGGCTD